jgi:hypothetical protein
MKEKLTTTITDVNNIKIFNKGKKTLFYLPDDVITTIICDAICLNINLDNYKNDPVILQVHPLLRRYIKYFGDCHWKLICEKIINEIYEFDINLSWQERFVKSCNINIRLSNLLESQKLFEIRNLKNELELIFKNKKMSKNLVEKLFYNNKCCVHILREFLSKFDIEDDAYKNLLDNYNNLNFENQSKSSMVHIDREIINHLIKNGKINLLNTNL